MFAQFRSQYPQGRIQTEMLPKIDGLHAFRAIVSAGESIMGTATAVDSDLEIAEDRAVKRALTIAGLAFDNGFENNYGNYGSHSPMLTQVSREPSSVNSLPSANFNQIGSLETSNHAVHSSSDNSTHTIQAESTPDYASDYGNNFDYMPSATIEPPKPEPITSAPKLTSEAVDLSDAISKIDVEMERLGWKKEQGRDYLVRTFHKKSRQQLTDAELLQFLSHLKSLATPHRQAENDDFF
ncbi:hypothetical protein [Pseudanabaena mucicola]|uniref:DRBM domain-containing protein n=1 Tax=Pseudanabaena mucicola FACHB-723 TaxID=2692860 RepID=A0ABR7ZW17_9CYAN|nr:hypothetical protein [Pseudanabaena mucicola]MBD2187441.1 hypothetical protein [Pseudanabaena mucicola FACHB-723]